MAKKEEIIHTKYEKARMLGSRALQISMGAPFLLKLSDEELEELAFNPIEIAKLEYEKGVIPITVRRPLPSEDVPSEEKKKKKAKA